MSALRIRVLAGSLVLAAVVAPRAGTAHQNPAACNGTITTIGRAPGPIVYVDDRHRAAIDHYFYLESNGHAGLQTGGESATSYLYPQYDGCFNHSCRLGSGPDCPRVTPDTFVF